MKDNGINLDIFEILVKQNYEKVYRAIYFYTNNKLVTEDSVQQAFALAYCKLDQLSSKEKFTSWVISIGLNEAKRMIKDRNKSTITSILDTKGFPDKIDNIELKEDINNVLNKLKQQDAEILVLKYYADLPLKQIATLLGINISNVKVRLHRAKEKFRELMDNDIKSIGG
ncbi:sigma-70 family RNA polymerase sigma factor [Desulfosporosinus sp. FKA]|uniref:RNA polymerase sigma factor n=1 Tax=Desulfosporosinus sp. FKA TaxID=1969834 RepID=UPI001FA86174|nr:sigma-70 family RNA polymerase sigma factor [Desulfosporosinus sp. FKA]